MRWGENDTACCAYKLHETSKMKIIRLYFYLCMQFFFYLCMHSFLYPSCHSHVCDIWVIPFLESSPALHLFLVCLPIWAMKLMHRPVFALAFLRAVWNCVARASHDILRGLHLIAPIASPKRRHRFTLAHLSSIWFGILFLKLEKIFPHSCRIRLVFEVDVDGLARNLTAK